MTVIGTSYSVPSIPKMLAALAHRHQELTTVVQAVLDAYHRADNAVVFADQFSKHASELQRLVRDEQDAPQC